MTPKLPEVKITKNGYEIRTEILKYAQEFVIEDFRAKWMGWEISQTKSNDNSKLITSVTAPEFPGVDQILATAEKMYSFVNQNNRAE